jgi:glutamate-ammonia-ligase adenylyltransferase
MPVCEPAKVSAFLARWVKLHPTAVAQLAQTTPLGDKAITDPAAAGASLGAALRRHRHAELARIAYRDLAGLDDLETILVALSDLADRCIEAALRGAELELDKRYGPIRDERGQPVRLTVIAMGKLGGRELNFSSDIDLIFAYDGAALAPSVGDLDADGHFRRIARSTIKLLSEVTAQGLAYRVDTRLRPFGDAGALVSSISAMEQYYQAHGREWERYAWIKARPVAGDLAGGRQLIATLRPFVYRRYLDYGAFESIREMKTLIEKEIARSESQANIKLGYGGIREIEFIAQVFQLIRGGREPELQDTRLRPTLAKLAAARHLDGDSARRLDGDYVFLRRLENRLQMVDDRQTHDLPTDPLEGERIAVMMGEADGATLRREIAAVRNEVHGLFETVFALPAKRAGARPAERARAALAALWGNRLGPAAAGELLSRHGITDTEQVLAALAELRAQSGYGSPDPRGQRWLAELVPALIVAASHNDSPTRAVLRSLQVIHAILGRSNYLALLIEYPAALATLVRLCAASQWITERIAAQPALLDSFVDPQQLYHPPRRTELAEALAAELAACGPDDLEQRMDTLRHFTQRTMLRIAAADVTDAMPLMIVSDRLTELAELVLAAALEMAWQQMRSRYGEPRLADGSPTPFTVLGYGRLGGLELGYRSDLDLVFVYARSAQETTQGGARELTPQVFFTRLAQRLIHILSLATPAGRAYAIDMRLRPSGDAGLMVSPLDAFARYQSDKAWTWEHQALVRARPVAGDAGLGERFAALRREILGRERDLAGLAGEIAAMRERMRRAKDATSQTHWDVRQMPGGLVDIEFMAQFAVLAYGHRCPELLIFTDAIRILETLESAQLVPFDEIQALTHAYRDYRRMAHAAALQRQPAMIARASRREGLRQRIAELWAQWIGTTIG